MFTDSTRGLCQSCGAAFHGDADHGTDRGGGLDPDYCRRCFHEGAFLEPHLSMFAVIERFDREHDGAPPGPAGKPMLGRTIVPKLKRWRNTTP